MLIIRTENAIENINQIVNKKEWTIDIARM